MKKLLVVGLFVLSVLIGACGKEGCYSQYTGCEATATFIQKWSDPNYRNATPVPAPTK